MRFFDRGLVFMVVFLALLLITFGVTRWYVSTLEKRMLALETEVAERTAGLKGQEVDRVADFVDRLKFIDAHLLTEPDPTRIFSDLEQHTLPEVRLTLFEYNLEEGLTRIGGESNSLKEVAQQMVALKLLPEIAEVTVEKVEYNKEGRIIFVLALKRQIAPAGEQAS